MRVFMMRWSPDARSIAFMGKEPGKTWKIYSISTEGGQPQIVSEEARSQADPDWSPDGKTIVFGRSSEYMAEDSTPKAIQMVDLATRQSIHSAGFGGLFQPAMVTRWPLPGRDAARPAQADALRFRVRRSGRNWPAEPSTIRSGRKTAKYIYYQSYDEGSPICRMQVAGGRVEKIADFRDLPAGSHRGLLGHRLRGRAHRILPLSYRGYLFRGLVPALAAP